MSYADDGVNVVKAIGRDGRFLVCWCMTITVNPHPNLTHTRQAGGGACDIELARQLKAFAETRSGLEQVIEYVEWSMLCYTHRRCCCSMPSKRMQRRWRSSRAHCLKTRAAQAL